MNDDRRPEDSENASDHAAELDRADRICDAYEREWIDGRVPQLLEFLAMAPKSDQANLRVELELLEQDYQNRRADTSPNTNRAEQDQDTSRGPTVASAQPQDEALYRIAHALPLGRANDGLAVSQTGIQAGKFETSGKTRESDVSVNVDHLRTDAIGGYTIVKELHRGGQGIVYQAVQESTKQKVALKLLLQGEFAGAEQRRRFEREIELVGSLHHPHIAKIFDSGVASGQLFFAMQYIRGKKLTDHADDSQLGPNDKLRLLKKVCDAVDHAHQRGVIHRDLKPSNILVDDRDKQPYVLDFGLAKIGGANEAKSLQVSLTGQILGTPAYMSPEQAAGLPDAIDMRSDVYSLGVIAYELLTTKLPHDVSGQISDVLSAIQQTEPKRPCTINRQIPDEVDTIVMKALSKDRTRRYPTAGAIGADIQRYLDGEAIEAKRDSVMYLAKRILRRHRLTAATAAAFVIVVCVALVTSLTFWQRAAHDRDLAVADRAALRVAQTASEIEAKNARAAEQKALSATEVAVEAREEQRRELYASHIQDMRQAYGEGAIDRIDELLKQYVPLKGQTDLRGWEWYYWWRTSRRQVRQLTSERGGFMGMSVSSSRRWFAVKKYPDSVSIYPDAGRSSAKIVIPDVARWREFRADVAISPDGQHTVAIGKDSRGKDSLVRLWPTAPPYAELPSLPHAHDLVAIVFSSTGMLAAADDTGQVTFWNVAKQTQLGAPLETGQTLRTIAFSPNGGQLVTGSTGNDEESSLLVWSLTTRKIDASLVKNDRDVRSLAWSSRGDRDVLAAGFADGYVRLWNTDGETFEAGNWLPTGGPVLCMAFSPDGGRLVAGTSLNKAVHVWDTDSARLINTAKGHSQRIWGVAFADEGSTVWSCSEDNTLNTWDVSKCGAFDRLASAPPEVVRGNRSLIFGAEGQSLWSGGMSRKSDGSPRPVFRWSLDGDDKFQKFASEPSELVAISANGQFQVEFTQESDAEYRLQVRRMDVTNPSLLPDLLLPNTNVDGPPMEMAISDDGSVVAWSRDNQLVLIDIENGRHTTWSEDWKGRLLTLSHDGGMLAAVESQETRIWDVTDDVSKLVPKGTFSGQGIVFDVQFSSDGRHLAAAGWGSKIPIQLIDAERGELIANLSEHAGRVNSVCFSRDGRHLVSGGMDATVRLWDVERQSLRLTLPSHDRPVMSVAISPDGQTIASMSDEGDTRLWRGGTQEMQGASYGHWLAEIRNENESPHVDTDRSKEGNSDRNH